MTARLSWALGFVLTIADVGCTPATFTRAQLEPQLTRHGPLAFHLLAHVSYEYRSVACGTYHGREAEAHVLDDADAYAALYADWKLCWQPPAVDFSRYLVVALLLPAAGCEGELVSFALSATGHLTPRVVWLGDMCNQIEVYHRFLAAIPRSALPADGVYLDVEHASASVRWSRAATRTPTSAARRSQSDTAQCATELPLGKLSLPPRGEARLERLSDDSLAWIVRATDEDLSVVSAWASAPGLPESPEMLTVAGISFPVWWTSVGRFYGRWSYYDPHGINLTGLHLRNLDAFCHRVQDGMLAVFGPGSAESRVAISDPATNQQTPVAREALTALFPEPALSLAAALRAPEGAALKIDADVVRLGADPRVRLCHLAADRPADFDACSRDGAWIEDARVVAPTKNPHADGAFPAMLGAHADVNAFARGPVLARRTKHGFARVRLLRGSVGYSMRRGSVITR